MIKDGMSNRQLALILAVETLGDRAHSIFSTETLANQYYNYLENGTMR